MSLVSLFFKAEINREHHEAETYQMIPAEFAHFKHFYGDNHEDDKAYNLLNHFELHKVKRTAVHFRADTVGGHHK